MYLWRECIRGADGGNWLDGRILVALLWSPTVSPLKERRGREGSLRELRSVMWALRQESWTMMIPLVPGHYFLGENERADEEARRGGRSELSREESVNLSLFRRDHYTALGSWCALVGRQDSAEGRFCGEENETAQHLRVWCSAFKEERLMAWFGNSLRELVRRPSLPRRCSELCWVAESEAQQKLHLRDNISSGPAQYALPATLSHFLFIYIFYIPN